MENADSKSLRHVFLALLAKPKMLFTRSVYLELVRKPCLMMNQIMRKLIFISFIRRPNHNSCNFNQGILNRNQGILNHN